MLKIFRNRIFSGKQGAADINDNAQSLDQLCGRTADMTAVMQDLFEGVVLQVAILFLSDLLECCRLHQVRVRQDANFSEIYLIDPREPEDEDD